MDFGEREHKGVFGRVWVGGGSASGTYSTDRLIGSHHYFNFFLSIHDVICLWWNAKHLQHLQTHIA